MKKELKKKALLRVLPSTIVCLVIGILIFATQWRNIKVFFSPVQNLVGVNITDESQLREGRVECEVQSILGYYDELSSSESGDVFERSYVMQIGRDKMIGIVIPEEYVSAADANFAAANRYFEGEKDAINDITALKFSGSLMKMDSYEKEKYQDFLNLLDATEEQKHEMFLPYSIKVNCIGNSSRFGFYFWNSIAFLFLAAGVFQIIRAVSGAYQKEIHAFVKRGDEEAMIARLNRFYETAPEAGNARMSSEFFLYSGKGSKYDVFLESPKLLWIYANQEDTRKKERGLLNVLGVLSVASIGGLFVFSKNWGKNQILTIVTDDGKSHKICMKRKKEVEEVSQIVNLIRKNRPFILFGYSQEREQMIKENLQSVVSQVHAREIGMNSTELVE